MRGRDDSARIRIVGTGYCLFDSFMGLVFCGGEVMCFNEPAALAVIAICITAYHIAKLRWPK